MLALLTVSRNSNVMIPSQTPRIIAEQQDAVIIMTL